MCWGLLLSQQCCTVGTEPCPGADAVFSGVSPVFLLCSPFLGKSLLLVKPLEVVAWRDALRYNPDTKAIVGLFPIDSSAAQRGCWSAWSCGDAAQLRLSCSVLAGKLKKDEL